MTQWVEVLAKLMYMMEFLEVGLTQSPAHQDKPYVESKHVLRIPRVECPMIQPWIQLDSTAVNWSIQSVSTKADHGRRKYTHLKTDDLLS